MTHLGKDADGTVPAASDLVNALPETIDALEQQKDRSDECLANPFHPSTIRSGACSK